MTQDEIIKSISYEQDEILQWIIDLYCHNGFQLDPTYSKGNFYKTIQQWNKLIRKNKKLTKEELQSFLCSMNSYLGIMKHYKTYKIRRKMLLNNLSAYYWNYVYLVRY